MRLRALVLVAAVGLWGIGDEEDPGWLARKLASEDADVEAAIEAYEAGDLDTAAERLDAAFARRGDRAELFYDRGLLLLADGDAEAARKAFEHGTESSDVQVRASSHYELGNLSMQAEDWDGAIASYIECLRTQPEHQEAKWNLELALLRKEEQEKQEQEQQDQQDQEQQDQGEEGEQDQQDQQDQGEEVEQDQQDQQDQGEEGEQDQQDQQGEEEQQDQQQGEEEQQDQQQGEKEQQQPGEEQQQEQEEQQVQPQPVEPGELDAALEELDRQDAFMFGRPRGNRKVEKDW